LQLFVAKLVGTNVFGSAKASTPEEALAQWKASKLKEKANKNK